jgi:hypothetical protein
MDLLLTEVTNMGSMLCVAGWHEATQRVVRPVPREHGWDPRLHDDGVLVPGNIVQFSPDGRALSSTLPHATEDVAVATRTTLARSGSAQEMARSLARTATASAKDALGVWPDERRFVLPGTACRSLGAILIRRHQFALRASADSAPKLRADLTVGKWVTSLPVSSRALQADFAAGGVEAALARIGPGARLYLRLGFAREYQGKCFLMVNNAVGVP